MPIIELERDEHGNPINLSYHEDRFIRYFNKLIKDNQSAFDVWAADFIKRKSEYWLSELLKRIGLK